MVLRVIPSFRKIFDLVSSRGVIFFLYIVYYLQNDVLTTVYDAIFPFVMTLCTRSLVMICFICAMY